MKKLLNEVLKLVKKRFYFLGARYFAYFAFKRLQLWQPQVIVVTGSTGKTTALALLEAQFGDKAFYSHDANSAYGVPFNILGLEGNDNFDLREWLRRFWLAPSLVKNYLPEQRIYIVECDCDRPEEGRFLADLLSPDAVIWLNTIATHAMNFDYLVKKGKFKTVEEAIAYEFGFFVERCQKMVIANGDYELIKTQLARINQKKVKLVELTEKGFLWDFELNKIGTIFNFVGTEISVPTLLPKATWFAVAATEKITNTYNIKFDREFKKIDMPPGRSSIFKGIRGTTIIDSTYNSSPLAVKEMLRLFDTLKAKHKWLILGDMLELGRREKIEHEKLADEIKSCKGLKKVILFGERVKKYTAPLLENSAVVITSGQDLYQYLMDNISGEETLLFKGAQGGVWEAIVELLLLNPVQDKYKLARRSPTWERRRQGFFESVGGGGMNRISGGVRLAVRKKEKIFIVPGWSYSLDKWQMASGGLENLGYEVEILPVPGLTGEKLSESWDLDDYVVWLGEKLKEQKNVIVIGHSNGGRILLRYIAKNPEKIKQLILIDSAGLIDNRWHKKMKRRAGKKLAMLGKKIANNEHGRKLLYKILRESDYENANPVMKKTMANLIRKDLSSELKKVKVPTLLIWGKNDQQTPLFQGRQMKSAIKNSRLEIIEEARHSPQFTHPEQVVTLIGEFLESQRV
ncbi:MAG: alpha/beta fold hydrolase [Pseudomonadales bacterium]|nr:alpha/beta fold hydrolase [Pseudomonadales bacterium]